MEDLNAIQLFRAERAQFQRTGNQSIDQMARPEESKEELEARGKQAARLLNRTDMDISKVAEVEGVMTRRCRHWSSQQTADLSV